MAIDKSYISKRDNKLLEDMIQVRAHEERFLGLPGLRSDQPLIRNTIPVWARLGLMPLP